MSKFQAVLDFVPAGSPDKFRSLRSKLSGAVVPRRVLNLGLQSGADTTRRDVAIDDLVVAGWTGRDPAAVEKHIKELEALGVKRPGPPPTFFSRLGGRPS